MEPRFLGWWDGSICYARTSAGELKQVASWKACWEAVSRLLSCHSKVPPAGLVLSDKKKKALMSIYAATFNEGVSCEIKTKAKDIQIINANVSDNSNLQENISIKTCFYLRWFKVKNDSLFQIRHYIFLAASGLGLFPNIDDHMGRFSQWVKLQVK